MNGVHTIKYNENDTRTSVINITWIWEYLMVYLTAYYSVGKLAEQKVLEEELLE